MNFHSMDNHKPRMLLKDFLNERISTSSCSSSNNGFKSLPRKPSTSTSKRTLIETDLNLDPNYSNPGIWCTTRLSKSAFQTLLNAVKAVSFFTGAKKTPPANENKSTMKLKDIMQWKLCRDVVAEVETEERTSTAAAVAAVAAASCSSSGWSCWSESDLSSWECDFEEAENDVVVDFEFSLFCFSPFGDGKDYVGAATRMAKVENKGLIFHEEQEHSPISVLHQVEEDEFSPFDQSLDNNQRTNQTFIQQIQKFDTLEEHDNNDDKEEEEEEDCIERRAREILHYVKLSNSTKKNKSNLDKVLLDIVKEELNVRRNQASHDGGNNFELEILKLVEDWIYREQENKDGYVNDLDWRMKFDNKYEDEENELALEIENIIFYELVGEVLWTLIYC